MFILRSSSSTGCIYQASDAEAIVLHCNLYDNINREKRERLLLKIFTYTLTKYLSFKLSVYAAHMENALLSLVNNTKK